jgi:hypothetical protein
MVQAVLAKLTQPMRLAEIKVMALLQQVVIILQEVQIRLIALVINNNRWI